MVGRVVCAGWSSEAANMDGGLAACGCFRNVFAYLLLEQAKPPAGRVARRKLPVQALQNGWIGAAHSRHVENGDEISVGIEAPLCPQLHAVRRERDCRAGGSWAGSLPGMK